MTLRRPSSRTLVLGLLAAIVLGVVYLAATATGGVADPTEAPKGSLSHGTVVFDSAILVLREGLEAILVLAAVLAGLRGTNAAMRRPVAAGAGVSLGATIVTWFAAVWVLGQLGGSGLDIQAATGLLAVIVLMVVMNWFLHRVYWTGWMSNHHKRRRGLLDGEGTKRAVWLGFALLGFTAVYREGFEIVLFLQSLRLRSGSGVVLQGVALGFAGTLAIGYLTFRLNAKLPYRKMLVITGILLGFVLLVMVGEGVQEMQLAGWVPTTSIGFDFPGWMGTWFALFGTVETLAAQAFAAVFVVGSYYLAEHLKVRRPVKRGEAVVSSAPAASAPAPKLAAPQL